MANQKLRLRIITAVALAVGIPLTILLWWETYKIALVYHGLTRFITITVFGVLVSVGGSIAVFLVKRHRRELK